VHYGNLIAAARSLLREQQTATKRFTSRLELFLLSRLPYWRFSGWAAYLYQRSGLRRLVRRIGGNRLARQDNLMPELEKPTRWRQHYLPAGESYGRVGLFTGCISRLADQRALLAAIKVLNSTGLEVIVPKRQTCCGAMALDAGEPDEAQRLALINSRAFAGLELEAMVTVASGCGAHLVEHGKQGPGLPGKIWDICAYLSQHPRLRKLKLRPLKKRVAIHTPCTLENVLGTTDAPMEILRQIPEINLFPLPENGLCCGAAGRYLLQQPEIADGLRDDKLRALEQSRPQILLTSNTGCALHLAAGIREAGLEIEVMHPVELLARQLQSPATDNK
jgi:glycolate oxidase iron-sulfur subunit